MYNHVICTSRVVRLFCEKIFSRSFCQPRICIAKSIYNTKRILLCIVQSYLFILNLIKKVPQQQRAQAIILLDEKFSSRAVAKELILSSFYYSTAKKKGTKKLET